MKFRIKNGKIDNNRSRIKYARPDNPYPQDE